jgi:tetratricopeptide (TPR) repeat protein
MRHTTRILITLLLACWPLFAQGNLHEQLRDALVLEQQGKFDSAIKMAKLVTDSNQLNGIELGRAYIILGVAYRAVGKFAAAQNSFEQSVRILERDPEHVSDYAAALNNYAGLYSDFGELHLAERMWLKALHLSQEIGDHTALTRSLRNLAGLSLAQKRVHEAKRYLNRASDEMKLARDLVDDDLVLLFETQAWVALAEGHPSAAVAGYQRALEVCTRSRGEQHWLTGWEHMLRGKAYAESGDTKTALADMREGLAILDHALGPKNPTYFLAQIAYSQVLERAGLREEAARLRATAEQARKDLYGSECVGCTITVAGFR